MITYSLIFSVNTLCCQCVCEFTCNCYICILLAHLMQQPRLSALNMTNPVNESAYMELRSDYLSATSPTDVVGTHNEVSVMMMPALTKHDLINYRPRNFHIMMPNSLLTHQLLLHQLLLHLLNQQSMLISSSLLTHQLLLHLLNQWSMLRSSSLLTYQLLLHLLNQQSMLRSSSLLTHQLLLHLLNLLHMLRQRS